MWQQVQRKRAVCVRVCVLVRHKQACCLPSPKASFSPFSIFHFIAPSSSSQQQGQQPVCCLCASHVCFTSYVFTSQQVDVICAFKLSYGAQNCCEDACIRREEEKCCHT